MFIYTKFWIVSGIYYSSERSDNGLEAQFFVMLRYFTSFNNLIALL